MAVIAASTTVIAPAAMPLKFLVLLNWSGAVVVASSFVIAKSYERFGEHLPGSTCRQNGTKTEEG
jgi:hypothetical protein